LLAAGIIKDPFFGENERSLKWIAECDWKYVLPFDSPTNLHDSEIVHLVFDGLDTVATVILNGTELGTTDNMFLQYRFPVSALLKSHDNLLEVIFKSPLEFVREHRKPLRQFPSARHADRVFLRKAQYSFGWDWGPEFPTMGIWRPVRLEAYETAMLGPLIFETRAIDEDKAVVGIKVQTVGANGNDLLLQCRLSSSDCDMAVETVSDSEGTFRLTMNVPEPRLWWPRGSGESSLYRLDLELREPDGELLDRCSRKVGIRTVALELKDGSADTFRFRINGKVVYLKGANWIPADSFLSRVSDKKYVRLLNMAREANMNVLRVWGGGIYEEELFYDLCDELGILVWQDFMFACAAYPEDEAFIRNVKKELEYNVRRLQYHPSLLIWCGNNENEWIQHRDQCGPVEQMPGYALFHHHFPQWLGELDSTRPYWPSSPFGDDEDPNDPRSGNRHQWSVWSYWTDYTKVVEDQSLFVTEFGFQAPAHYHTFRKSLPEAALHCQSGQFEFHNKQEEGPERLFRFLSGHLPVRTELPDFIYLTQLNQAFALKTCLEHWRLNQPHTSGSVIWQLNDCWPVTSWALIDYELHPKLAWYAVRDSFANVLIAFRKNGRQIDLLLVNPHQLKGQIEMRKVHGDGEQTQIMEAAVPGSEKQHANPVMSLSGEDIHGSSIYIASFYSEKKDLIARTYHATRPWKYQTLPEPAGKFKLTMIDSRSLEISTDVTLYFVQLTHPVLDFSDGGFILLPGESRILWVSGGHLTPEVMEEIRVFHLNAYLS
jgi:beta-mannosidase